MKNKNGFTLIELLAVIVILAIILVIAVPQVMKVVNQSKTDSFKSSATMILKAVETEYLIQQLAGSVTLITTGTSTACPTGIAKWDTANGACNYTLTLTGSDINVLTVTLTGGSGKFVGTSNVTVTR